MPTRRRTSTGSASGAYTSCPSMETDPVTRVEGMSSFIRFNARRNVLLPHPEGPTHAVTRWAGMRIDTLSRARVSP